MPNQKQKLLNANFTVIEEDFIESFIQLNVVEEKAEELLADIEKFKAKH